MSNNDAATWDEFQKELMSEIAEGQGLTLDEYKGEIEQARDYSRKRGGNPDNDDDLLDAYCTMRDVERSFFEDECKEAASRIAGRTATKQSDKERKEIGEQVSTEYAEGRMNRDEFRESQYAREHGLN